MPPSIAAADPLDFSETVAMPHAHARAGGRALRCVAAAWWAVAFAGQLLFAFYIVMFYAGNALAGRPEAWNAVIKDGYVAGDTDLVWTRLTHWRALLAAALDFPPHDTISAVTVGGEAVSPSTDLMAGWLAAQLGVKVKRVKSETGAGMVSVRLERRSGPVELMRPDGRTATLRQPGQPDRLIALARRTVPDCLAEELRRLDPDEVYAAALKSLSKVAKGRTPASKPEEAAAEQANGKAAAPAAAKKPKAKASS